MRLVLAALAALIIASAAHAPDSRAQGMDCRATEGGRMVCSEGFRAMTDRLAEQAQGRAAPAAGASAIQAPPGAPPAAIATAPPLTPKQRRLVAAVAKAIQAGRCDEARAIALEQGDYPLADQVPRLCAPRADPG